MISNFLSNTKNIMEKSIMDYYEIGQLLGSGSYGKVYVCTHKSSKLKRAVKSIKKQDINNNDPNQQILEMVITKSMDHPSILKLYEIYQDQKFYYMIIDFCRGGELFERIKNLDNFQIKNIQYLMKQILQAVNYLHHQQIVHRDLKPENILFEDLKNEIKICDFGFATYFQEGQKLKKKAGSVNSYYLKIFYMSPEQIQLNYDQKCDVWACGVIMYILFCGSPPFYGKNETQIKNKILSGKFQMNGNIWSKIDESAKDLIKKLLVVNPAERISAQQALNHPFIQKNQAEHKFVDFNLIKTNLTDFEASNKFKNAVMQFVSSQILSFQDTKELKEMFMSIDTNGDGSITIEEYEASLATQGIKSKQELEDMYRLFMKIDLDGSGRIDYTEFLAAMSNQQETLNLDNLRIAFNMFDKDGNQQLTKDEIVDVLQITDDDKFSKMMEKYDTNGDGTINFNEFLDLIKETIKEETQKQ